MYSDEDWQCRDDFMAHGLSTYPRDYYSLRTTSIAITVMVFALCPDPNAH